jgi:hypothetical protein
MNFTAEELAPLLQKSAHTAWQWPSIDDRAAWQYLATTPYGAKLREAAHEDAKQWLSKPLELPALTDYLALHRTGARTPWESRSRDLKHRLTACALAACFENDDTFLDGALNVVWAICEMWTWVMPAHHGTVNEAHDRRGIDLGTATRAMEITEAMQLLAPAYERMHPTISSFIQATLKERVFEPYLNRDDYWWLSPKDRPVNNWLAVCSGGVVLAALTALNDDIEYQARIVERAIWSLGHFLPVFGSAGSLDEGVSYWAYGFGHYVIAAERILARTGGKADLLTDPLWREVALFPLRVHLHGDTFVNFSDCPSRVIPQPGWLAWLGRHLELPEVSAWAARNRARAIAADSLNLPDATRNLFWVNREINHNTLTFPDTLRNLLWTDAEDVAAIAERPLAVFLPDVEWFLARSKADDDALVLAVKAGHNAEMHNHNDGGSFVVHYCGEALIDEIGKPTYTRQFFASERYENIAARSLGHSVPLLNAIEQREGPEHAAHILQQDADSITLDLKDLYPPEAGLLSLRREIEFHRDGEGFITLSEAAEFENDGATFAAPLIVKDHDIVLPHAGRAEIRAQRSVLVIEWPPEEGTARVEPIETDDTMLLNAQGLPRFKQLWFDINVNNRQASLHLKLIPNPQ